jgi:hypothetical protein
MGKRKMRKGKMISFIALLSLLLSVTYVGANQSSPQADGLKSKVDMFDLLEEMLINSSKKDNSREIQKVLSLSTKFKDRSQLMTREVLGILYNNYEKCNVLVDFIEKIPIKEPRTVFNLFMKADEISRMDDSRKDKAIYTSIFQSFLELFSQTSTYAPNRYNYDDLIFKLLEVPFLKAYIYDDLFKFMKNEFKVKAGRRDLVDVVLEGISPQTVTIENVNYVFDTRKMYKSNIKEIFESQEVCSFSKLLRINDTLSLLLKQRQNLDVANRLIKSIDESMEELPVAAISHKAPKSLRNRVTPYSKDKQKKDINNLLKKINNSAPLTEIESLVQKLKNDYLIHQLKHHLLTLVYALNAKNPNLREFLNPNTVRLHDFNSHKERTPWNYCGPPPVTDSLSRYYLCGGLSRLNVAFSSKWNDHLFSRTYIYNTAQLKSVLINLMELYPLPMADQYVIYNALMVDLGWELLRKSREDESLGQEILKKLSTITSGYHYRKAVDYVNGISKDHNLFFSEIRQLGESFFNKGLYPEGSSLNNHLDSYKKSPLSDVINTQAPRYGSIYYNSFGNLKPQQLGIFPQELSNFFNSGWISGEMIDEFKIKLGWHLYKRKMPPLLLGQVLFTFMNKTAPRFYSQNHSHDYYSTYFLFRIFNNSHLKKIVKDLQKSGYLILK